MTKTVDCECRAFRAAIDVLGHPWTAQILTVLQPGPLRFCEIGQSAHHVGDKMLSARLKDLEARGLVDRRVDAGPPVHVSYALTPKGRAFGRVAQAIERWGRELVADAPGR